MKQVAIKIFLLMQDTNDILQVYNKFCKKNDLPEKSELYDKSEIYFDQLAEFLVEWGDSGYNFDITNHLIKSFKEYAYNCLSERYDKNEIETIVNESYADFLMDDWNDILIEDFENVIGICPKCLNVIYSDNEHEYIYETGKTKYECEFCDNSIFI